MHKNSEQEEEKHLLDGEIEAVMENGELRHSINPSDSSINEGGEPEIQEIIEEAPLNNPINDDIFEKSDM